MRVQLYVFYQREEGDERLIRSTKRFPSPGTLT